MKKRFVSMFLVLSMVCALFVVPASAAFSYSPDTNSRDYWDLRFNRYTLETWAWDRILKSKLFNVFNLGSDLDHSDLAWSMVDWISDRCAQTYGQFGVVSENALLGIKSQFVSNFIQWDGSALAYYIDSFPFRSTFGSEVEVYQHKQTSIWQEFFGYDTRPDFYVTYDVSSGIYRIGLDVVRVSDGTVIDGGYLTNSNGHYWYALPDDEEDSPADTIPDITAKEENRENGVIWVSSDTANGLSLSGYVTLLTQDQLSPYRTWGRQSRGNMVEYRAINNFTAVSDLATNSYLAYRFYNGDGTYKDSLLVTPSKLSNYYTGTEQTVSDNTGNGDTNLTIGDVLLLDALNKFIVSPEGDINFIDNVTFDQSSKTYNFTTNNEYNYYDNRSWSYSWTYHINYTSITYIGQSEEYDKSYEFYYQLPDGRSSADLTAEELEQLNLAVDVINYGRSADDTRLRSLYHFDGNTDDASYWNYCTAFTWNQGASLTYLESGNFNGALYLDETDHDFTLTLPSSIGSNDFTLQFRYYQSATAAPQNDSYIRFGSTDLMRFNGSQILNGSGTALSSMPIGTWNELAIIRESGTVRYYLNGVQLGTVSNTTAFNAAVTFHFGSSQQTYKELDELRVLNYALAEGGSSYTPTSVPHDTNLALVLPDSVVPVADEYWDIHNDSQTNLLSQYNLDWWDIKHSTSGVYSPYFSLVSPYTESGDFYLDGSNKNVQYKYQLDQTHDTYERLSNVYSFSGGTVYYGTKFTSNFSYCGLAKVIRHPESSRNYHWQPTFYSWYGGICIGRVY